MPSLITLSPCHLVTLSPCHLHPLRLTVYAGGVAMAVVLFLASGTGQWLLHRQPRPMEARFDPETPVWQAAELRAWLERRPADDNEPVLVFASSLWSDYVLWELPPPARVYWYSHWNCFKVEQMTDGRGLEIAQTTPSRWRKFLEGYRINVVVLQATDPATSLYEYLLTQEGNPEADWQILCKSDNDREAAKGKPAGLVAVRRSRGMSLATLRRSVRAYASTKRR